MRLFGLQGGMAGKVRTSEGGRYSFGARCELGIHTFKYIYKVG